MNIMAWLAVPLICAGCYCLACAWQYPSLWHWWNGAPQWVSEGAVVEYDFVNTRSWNPRGSILNVTGNPVIIPGKGLYLNGGQTVTISKLAEFSDCLSDKELCDMTAKPPGQ
jgi:hypothetical protein